MVRRVSTPHCMKETVWNSDRKPLASFVAERKKQKKVKTSTKTTDHRPEKVD